MSTASAIHFYQKCLDKRLKEDDFSFKTFEDEFSIQVSDSFRTKTDKLKWINDLIKFSNAWTTTKGRPLSQTEVNEIKSIQQNLLPTEEI